VIAVGQAVLNLLALLVQRKCKCTSSVNGQYGINPTGRYAHMFEEERNLLFIVYCLLL
jgi:hypothetical protein